VNLTSIVIALVNCTAHKQNLYKLRPFFATLPLLHKTVE